MPRTIRASLLGDETDTEEEFQSPDEDLGQTDYGLNYASTIIQNPFAPSTSRNAQKITRVSKVQPTARKRTVGRPRVQTPSASTTQSGTVKRRKACKPLHRSTRLLSQIKFLMSTTHTLIPRLTFARLVKEILMIISREDMLRITKVALEALHESTELYITQQLQDAYTLTLHRGRVTLSVKDMELLRFLRGRL